MSELHLTTCETLKTEGDRPRLVGDIPTIKILLYTDHPHFIRPGMDGTDLGTMIDHLHAHPPTFGRLCIEWLSRNSNDADNKLSPEKLKEYDQIWFFGVHQLSGENVTAIPFLCGPESELDEAEVRALGDWMKIDPRKKLRGGGVLVTGDHATQRPAGGQPGQNKLCPDKSQHEAVLGLGRALGRCVPRAGSLRKWEGKPTKSKKDSYNTQTPVEGSDPDDSRLEDDAHPLQLLLKRFDSLGNPAVGGFSHPLFFYKKGKLIQVFPDHNHEGAVIIPDHLDMKVWPKGKFLRPKPRVVAQTLDHRNGRLLNILAAYNGDCARVGRIVADSTWHHYLNINLTRFRPPAQEGSDADQIGQFYGNLAIWLSPRSKRREMAHVMLTWLVSHLFILEELRLERHDCEESDLDQMLDIGRAAYSILSRVASPCEIHELLQAIVPDEYSEKFETLNFPERGCSLSCLPSKELILGSIIDSYQQELIRINAEGQSSQLDFVATTNSGFKQGFQEHVNRLREVASHAHNVYNIEST